MTMLHFGEVFSVEIYARGGIVVGGVKRAEGNCGAETPKSAWGSAKGLAPAGAVRERNRTKCGS